MKIIQLPLFPKQGEVVIPLTKGYVTIVDAVDYDLSLLCWQAIYVKPHYVLARKQNPNGKPKSLLMSVVIAKRMFSAEELLGKVVDHKDGNPLNNRRSNLRLATHTENLRNSKKRRQGLKGACFHKRNKRWVASIRVNKKAIHLGSFDTEQEAHEAYCIAGREYFGEFFNSG